MIFFVATSGLLGLQPAGGLASAAVAGSRGGGRSAAATGPGAVPGATTPGAVPAAAAAVPQAAPETPAARRHADWRAFALRWDRKVLLTWRLPVLYGWLVILIAVCSFLGYWGFLAAAPAAAHYLAMWAWERARALR